MWKLVVAALFLGCAPQTRLAGPPMLTSAAPSPAVHEAASNYYAASTVEKMRAALAAAKAAGANSAVYHEIAANYAFLQSKKGEQFEHLEAALLDPTNTQASLHLHLLMGIPKTLEERSRSERLLVTLADQHPDAAVRSLASHLLAGRLHARRQLDAAAARRAAAGARLPFAVVGTWDNDQGKGFDAAYPPEVEIDLSQRLEGSLVEIEWRNSAPTSTFGADYNFGQLFSPSTWSVAYAVSAFEMEQAGAHQLRIQTSVPIKVWVNGALLFAERTIQGSAYDGLVLPVNLVAGTNRILIKSAQNTGSWLLMARLTDVEGRPLATTAQPGDATFIRPEEPSPTITTATLLDGYVAELPEGARKDLLRLEWARILGLRNQAMQLGDGFVTLYGKSIVGRYVFAGESWDHGERGQTADLLEAIVAETDLQLPFIPMQYARFLRQEDLTKKSRTVLEGLQQRYPENGDLWLRWARQFAKEGWKEDRCQALEKALAYRPGWETALTQLARCRDDIGFELEAADMLRALLAEVPFHQGALSHLQSIALSNEALDEAERLAELLTIAAADQTWTWHRLAEVRRRKRDVEGARRAYQRSIEIDPDNATPHQGLATLAYQNGEKKRAIQHWQTALTLNPDDEKLANRLSYLVGSEKKHPWEKEMPDEEEIIAAVRGRTTIKPPKGAGLLDLLDHEVTRFNPDGSTVSLVTRVVHAINKEGRDQITTMGMPRGGRIRVFHAYVIDPQGRRTQVSSIRDRTARFRGMKIGSTVVLQYRHDARPVGYLSKHVARGWWFQGSGRHVVLSQWVVWADQGTMFHESITGEGIVRTQDEREGYQRLSWTATNVPPVLSEPGMPTASESAMNMLISTVPSWNTFLEWEKALLADAFRETEEVRSIAAKILEGQTTSQEKIRAIHRYLMEEIRYQQDYEDHIAGVKPHSSAVVVKRQYGDCKDKAVLFITLARLAGLQAHFTLLRTRNKGPLRKSVPMQQFDHAIVYVPQQEGIEEGRFYDPTADAMDLHVLRSDDPGTEALVLDPKTFEHTWRMIPYQSPEHHRHSVTTRFELAHDGSAKGTFDVEAVGNPGVGIRKLARNEDKFKQGFQLYAGRAFPGGKAGTPKPLEVKDLNKPARVSVEIEAPSYARREDKELRIQLPRVWSPESSFRLAERKHPLILGAPTMLEWRSEITLPRGAKVVRLPKSGVIEAECFKLERKAERSGDKIIVVQRFETRCERITVERYQIHRERAEEMIRFYKEEIVLDVPKLDKAKSARLLR